MASFKDNRQTTQQRSPSDVICKQCLTCFICFNVTMKIFSTVFSTQTHATCFESFNLYVFRFQTHMLFPKQLANDERTRKKINKLMETHTSEWALLVISLWPHPAYVDCSWFNTTMWAGFWVRVLIRGNIYHLLTQLWMMMMIAFSENCQSCIKLSVLC